MTRIDFYVLPGSDEPSRLEFACRLAEKAVLQGNKVMIATKDEAESHSLDELLWRFRPESFVPHCILGDDMHSAEIPLVISHQGDDVDHHDVLVNIRNTRPEQFSRFARLAEIVTQAPDVLDNTRKSYAFYKSRGYPVNTHKM